MYPDRLIMLKSGALILHVLLQYNIDASLVGHWRKFTKVL